MTDELETQRARLAEALKARYTLDRVIGQGGMSIVFLAHDMFLDRPVAIKVLSPEVCSQVGADRFLREVRITANLQHPNILPLLDSGTMDGIVFSVMPFVEGESLRDRLIKIGRLPVEEALLYAREMAEALDYAHRRGIVHRDVKPENILLGDGQAVLTDFGIARAQKLGADVTLTGAGVPVGTPAYMSPEQVRSRDPADGRSDVYSLGCTLYEMLAGRPPFEGASVHEVLSMHVEQDPPPLERRRPELPDRVVAIVKKAMAKRPSERYQTAGEMAADLRIALGEPPRHPTPPTGPPPMRHSGVGRRSLTMLRPSGPAGWFVLVAVALGLLALLLTSERVEPPARTISSGPASVAVLPLTAQPAGSVAPFITEGFAAQVIAELNRVQDLRVMAQASSAMLAARGLLPEQIGDTLGVGFVLTGVVSPIDSNHFRTTVRLVAAGRGTTAWQRTYSFGDDNLAAVARQLAADAASALLAGAPLQGASGGGSASSSAIANLLLRGRYWMSRGTPEGMQQAREAFAAAVAQDSLSADALAWLAHAQTWTAIYSYRGSEDLYANLAQAVALARRAQALAPDNPEVALAIARTAYFSGASWDSAGKLYVRAIALSPNNPEALLDLAHVQGERGQVDSALYLARSAVAVDPLGAGVRHGAITVALRVRRPDIALEWSRARLAQEPGDLIAMALEGYALTLAGRSAECTDRAHGPWLAAQAICLHAAGRTQDAAVLADSLRIMLEQERYASVHQFTDLASYYAWTGRAPESLRWLERAIAHGPLLIEWVFTCGLYDRVMKDPTFQAGLTRVHQQAADRLAARVGSQGL